MADADEAEHDSQNEDDDKEGDEAQEEQAAEEAEEGGDDADDAESQMAPPSGRPRNLRPMTAEEALMHSLIHDHLFQEDTSGARSVMSQMASPRRQKDGCFSPPTNSFGHSTLLTGECTFSPRIHPKSRAIVHAMVAAIGAEEEEAPATEEAKEEKKGGEEGEEKKEGEDKKEGEEKKEAEEGEEEGRDDKAAAGKEASPTSPGGATRGYEKRFWHRLQGQSVTERWIAKKAEIEAAQSKECTHVPKVDANSKMIAAQKVADEGAAWWDILSKPRGKPKKKGEEKKDDEESKKGWKYMLKRQSYPYARRQDDDPKEPTFAPELNEKSKKLALRKKNMAKAKARAEKAAGTTSGEETIASESNKSGSMPASPLETTFSMGSDASLSSPRGGKGLRFRLPAADHDMDYPGPGAARPKRFSEPAMRMSRMHGAVPYRRERGPGGYPYARTQSGLTEDLTVDLQDPVFEDLHSMLHSLQL
eukprot:TRINITY_DN44837_c0_g2_i1.p1 TRINITY_DN44837_c0_g2~~TRINITY_DN44837_c0_g2_i1.p1  ORF type:complete len:476 (+),score=155.84 TRINITY_DN44837_c0_g2_i1:68-1495(+)